MPTIKMTGPSLGSEEAEEIYRQFHRAVSTERNEPLQIDMSQISFVRPSGVMSLVITARSWQRQRKQKTILTLLQPQVHAYLERIDLFSVGGNFVETSDELSAEQRFYRSLESRSVVELLPISGQVNENGQDVAKALKRITQVLSDKYGSDHPNIPRLCTLISELATNITHSRDQGYIMVQSYTDHSEYSRRVSIAIGDCGIGIEQSLRSRRSIMQRHRAQLATGTSFIQLSLEEGITSLKQRRGVGLPLVRQTVRDWRGWLSIRSLSSRVIIPTASPISALNSLPEMPGTQIAITAIGVLTG